MMRIVLDTNVTISAILNPHGSPGNTKLNSCCPNVRQYVASKHSP